MGFISLSFPREGRQYKDTTQYNRNQTQFSIGASCTEPSPTKPEEERENTHQDHDQQNPPVFFSPAPHFIIR